MEGETVKCDMRLSADVIAVMKYKIICRLFALLAFLFDRVKVPAYYNITAMTVFQSEKVSVPLFY